MAVTAIADDDSEFPVCLTGLISICMHVCGGGLVCSVEPDLLCALAALLPGHGRARFRVLVATLAAARITASECR